jgi:drug/metabolite transporter (DMT)-like permease
MRPPPQPEPQAPPAPTDVSLAPAFADGDGRPVAARRPAARALSAVPLGLRYMAGSALFFSVMSLLVKAASVRGLPAMEIVLVRCAVMMACTAALARVAGAPLLGHDRRTLAARGLGGAVALSLLYVALGRLPLGDATALHYTAPLWTTALAAPLLGERPNRALAGALAVSVAGVVLITKPAVLFGGAALDTAGVAAALVGSFLSGLAYVFVRKLRRTDHPLTVVFWLSWIGVAIALPFAATGWVAPDPAGWALLVGVGLATQVAQVLMTRGLHLEAAGRATAVGYLQVAFAFGWGWLAFGAAPDGVGLAGAALIVVATLLLARGARPGGREP